MAAFPRNFGRISIIFEEHHLKYWTNFYSFELLVLAAFKPTSFIWIIICTSTFSSQTTTRIKYFCVFCRLAAAVKLPLQLSAARWQQAVCSEMGGSLIKSNLCDCSLCLIVLLAGMLWRKGSFTSKVACMIILVQVICRSRYQSDSLASCQFSVNFEKRQVFWGNNMQFSISQWSNLVCSNLATRCRKGRSCNL